MQITDEFKDWFGREWSSYQDKNISGGKVVSMAWALKGYRAALNVEKVAQAEPVAWALTDATLRTAIWQLAAINTSFETEICDGMQILRDLLTAAQPPKP